MRRRQFTFSALSLAALSYCKLSFADASDESNRVAQFPNHAMRLIVPLAAGGGTDLISRLSAAAMAQELGVAIAVENVAGGGGIIGVSTAVRSPPDGYTLVTGTPSLSVNPALRKDLPFDPIADLAPVSMLGKVPYVLVASHQSGLTSIEQLLDRARQAPDTVTFGSPGIGTGGHMAGELFKYMSGSKLLHVPYKGSGPAMNDLRAGRIDLLFGTTPLLSPLIDSQAVVPLGISSFKRSKHLPDVPTISESGVKDFDASSWYAIFVPTHTPQGIIKKLNQAARAALAQPRVVQAIEMDGGEPEPSTPEQLSAFFIQEIDKWRKVVAAANIQAK